MNYKTKTFEELVSIINDASCELYDRVQNHDEENEMYFHKLWEGLTDIEKREAAKCAKI